MRCSFWSLTFTTGPTCTFQYSPVQYSVVSLLVAFLGALGGCCYWPPGAPDLSPYGAPALGQTLATTVGAPSASAALRGAFKNEPSGVAHALWSNAPALQANPISSSTPAASASTPLPFIAELTPAFSFQCTCSVHTVVCVETWGQYVHKSTSVLLNSTVQCTGPSLCCAGAGGAFEYKPFTLCASQASQRSQVALDTPPPGAVYGEAAAFALAAHYPSSSSASSSRTNYSTLPLPPPPFSNAPVARFTLPDLKCMLRP